MRVQGLRLATSSSWSFQEVQVAAEAEAVAAVEQVATSNPRRQVSQRPPTQSQSVQQALVAVRTPQERRVLIQVLEASKQQSEAVAVQADKPIAHPQLAVALAAARPHQTPVQQAQPDKATAAAQVAASAAAGLVAVAAVKALLAAVQIPTMTTE
jgi:hypothetical protein